MLMPRMNFQLRRGLPVAPLLSFMRPSLAADAAQATLKKNDCGKCHAVDKKKDGPSFKETAGKLKGKPDAEDEVRKHLTTGPKVKIDGKEEEHKIIKVKDDAELQNLIRWILSR